MASLLPAERLYSQIYDIDVDDQLESLKDQARIFEGFYQRLLAQSAPSQLSGLMARLRDLQVDSWNTLNSIKACFPPEPPKPPPEPIRR